MEFILERGYLENVVSLSMRDNEKEVQWQRRMTVLGTYPRSTDHVHEWVWQLSSKNRGSRWIYHGIAIRTTSCQSRPLLWWSLPEEKTNLVVRKLSVTIILYAGVVKTKCVSFILCVGICCVCHKQNHNSRLKSKSSEPPYMYHWATRLNSLWMNVRSKRLQ